MCLDWIHRLVGWVVGCATRRVPLWTLPLGAKGGTPARGEILGGPVAVAAMVDRLVHHAEGVVLRGDSYRLKGKTKEVTGTPTSHWNAQFSPSKNRADHSRR